MNATKNSLNLLEFSFVFQDIPDDSLENVPVDDVEEVEVEEEEVVAVSADSVVKPRKISVYMTETKCKLSMCI